MPSHGIDNIWTMIDGRTNAAGDDVVDVPSTNYHRLLVTSGHTEGVRFTGGFDYSLQSYDGTTAVVRVGHTDVNRNQAFIDHDTDASEPRYWVALRTPVDVRLTRSGSSTVWYVGLAIKDSGGVHHGEIYSSTSFNVPSEYVGGFRLFSLTLYSGGTYNGPTDHRPQSVSADR